MEATLQKPQDATKLSSLFDKRHVLCGVSGVQRHRCIRQLVQAMAGTGHLSGPPEAVAKAVLEREDLAFTQISPGLAIPHARVDAVRSVRIAVATAPDGIDFGSSGMGPAHIIILILAPKLATGDYLQALAGVARCFAKAGSIERVTAMHRPKDVWRFFDSGGALPEYVTARDVMRDDYPFLRHTDRLKDAIDLLCRQTNAALPVVDEDGDLVGLVTEEVLLKIALPEYILWLDDLSPILHFEPFAQVLKDEGATRVAEIMQDALRAVTEDEPAVRVACEMVRKQVHQIMVVRGKKLVGVITLSEFLARILRG